MWLTAVFLNTGTADCRQVVTEGALHWQCSIQLISKDISYVSKSEFWGPITLACLLLSESTAFCPFCHYLMQLASCCRES